MRALSLVSLAMLTGALLVTGCGGTTVTTTGGGGDTSAGGQGGSTSATGGSGGTGGVACQPSTELCDGIDNNCDGQVDEGCPCIGGETQPCYSGPDGTQGVGSCQPGTQTCDTQGTWGACTGEVGPATETCNGADDDCNGQTDDMGMLQCGTGACKVSVLACENGVAGNCVPGNPSIEICDGIDNNCNQLTDESFPDQGKACDTGMPGACKNGVQQCVSSGGVSAQSCVPSQMPAPEDCDGIDNDCNGVVDDNILGTGGVCSTGQLGSCDPGTISCQNGTIDCFPNVPAVDEICDGKDNNCNGVIDDLPGANTACSTGLLGACGTGVKLCQGAGLQCVQSVQQATEVCGDNVDNDCDGQVDEGCLYSFSGVATNLPIANLNGWTQCYVDTYANTGTSLSTILTTCNKAKLLLGCRATNAATLLVAANAPRLDVIFDTGTGNVTHDANGVGWYYNNSYSWGFAPQGDVVSRNSCDTTASSIGAGNDGDKRLCWHTGGNTINGGWRCGTNDTLNDSTTYQRLIFHAD